MTKLNDEKFRKEFLQGPKEEDIPGLEMIGEINEKVKAINPRVAIPYKMLSTLADGASSMLAMEYASREIDKEENRQGDDKLSIINDDGLSELEMALESMVHILMAIAKKLEHHKDIALFIAKTEDMQPPQKTHD